MLLLARRLSELGPLVSASTQQSVRILNRTFSDKPEVPNTTGNLDTSGATDKPEYVAKTNVNKTEKEILKIVNESNEVSMNKRHDNKLFFTNEEKAIMRNPEQRIPYTVEKEPGTDNIFIHLTCSSILTDDIKMLSLSEVITLTYKMQTCQHSNRPV